ncbi:uncharacterized protein [Halyomorpha halys]|uniref:uncharacterized protein isoform X2 n=1 Tax=Halyomorpha halys TaxID=286706 RepID=UPI0006D4D647|nr:uncharacterized protein LOC106685718 isoform X2 [Halyomorpha halys]
MRCSMRESHNFQPLMFTSTPISRRRKASAFDFFENSPITRPNPVLLGVPKQLIKYQNQRREQISVFKVLGTEKIPLIKQKGRGSFQKSTLSHPPMVVISDSEEEDKTEIKSEVTLSSITNSSYRRKSVRMDMADQKENIKRVRNRNTVKSLKDNFLETENKKSQKRISRVDAIIDEIMKERQSTALSPSPLVKLKSENSVDAIFEEGKNDLEIRRVTRSSVLTSQEFKTLRGNEQRNSYVPNILGGVAQTKTVEVTGKLKDIGNLDKINNIRRSRKGSQNVKKEKDIQYQGSELKIVNEETLTPLEIKTNFVEAKDNEIENKVRNRTSKTSSRAEPFNENLPVFYNQEEVNDNEWIQVNGQNGVFVKKNFQMLNISNGFVKIEAKCSLELHSVRSQIFNVAEGRGIFMYDNDKMKVKIGPGQTVTIPSGFPCKIINSGLKKNLVFTFMKIYSE